MAAKILPDQAYLRQCFEYDPTTGALTWARRPIGHFPDSKRWLNWLARFPGKKAGWVRKTKWNGEYIEVCISCRRYQVHRIIWKMVHGTEPPQIDHRNGIGTENWLDNLREATNRQNGCNVRKHKDGRAPFKGIHKHKRKWVASIGDNYKVIYLGLFNTPEEAHAAYCKAASELHREFANFGEDRHSKTP